VLVGSPSELPVKIQEQAKLDGIPENEIHGVLYKGVAYIVRWSIARDAPTKGWRLPPEPESVQC
jgi:hypothetical protein